jgi:hypothetical protein
MSKHEYSGLKSRLYELAALIAAATPCSIRFRSEQEFLELLSLQPVYAEGCSNFRQKS